MDSKLLGLSTLILSALLSATAYAQTTTTCTETGPLDALVGQVPDELFAGGRNCNNFNDAFMDELHSATRDGTLDAGDLEGVIAAARSNSDPETPGSYRRYDRISHCEWAVIRRALSGVIQDRPGLITVSDDIKPVVDPANPDAQPTLPAKLVDMLYTADMSPNAQILASRGVTVTAVGADGSRAFLDAKPEDAIPDEVKAVIAKAKYNGAIIYDYAWGKDDDPSELIFSGRDQGDPNDPDDDFSYPPISIANAFGNLDFDYTQISKKTLEADRKDTSPHLRHYLGAGSGPRGEHGGRIVNYNGEEIEVVDYTQADGTNSGGTVVSAYSPAFHAQQLEQYGLTPQDFDYPDYVTHDGAMFARTRDGSKWASNCGILEDGTIHCLPATRNHPCPAGGCAGVLTNPALARGMKMLWNGHVNISWRNGEPVVTSIGTSGRVAKRAARSQETLVDPVSVFKAWGIKFARGVDVRSEHREPHYVDHEKAIIYGRD